MRDDEPELNAGWRISGSPQHNTITADAAGNSSRSTEVAARSLKPPNAHPQALTILEGLAGT